MNLARSPSRRQNAFCPAAGMNPSDVQSETEPKYFDPEEVDMSEQQFAASLDATPAKPHFEIEVGVPEAPVSAQPRVPPSRSKRCRRLSRTELASGSRSPAAVS